MGANLILPAGSAASTTADPVTRSLRFGSGAYLSKTFGTPTDAKKKTISVWVKRSKLNDSNGQEIISYQDSNAGGSWQFSGAAGGGSSVNDDFTVNDRNATSGYSDYMMRTKQLFRDPAAWYHIFIRFDTTDSTAADRCQIWVNGERVTDWNTGDLDYPDLNYVTTKIFAATTGSQYIGTSAWDTTGGFDGYMADFYFTDGTAYDVTDFAETNSTTGQWIPKTPTGLTYGNNGFHLKFEDSSNIGEDSSGNSNDWTATNLASHDVMPDTPTKNYAVLNPLQEAGTNGSDPSEGNLSLTGGSNPSKAFSSTIAVNSGKYYAEFHIEALGYPTVAVGDTSLWVDGYGSGRIQGNGVVAYDIRAASTTGQYFINSTSSSSDAGISPATDDIIQVAFDADTRKVWFGRNGTWNNSGDPANGTNEIGTANGTDALTLLLRSETSSGSGTTVANYGQDPTFAGGASSRSDSPDTSQGEFYFAPPTGFKSLNTANLDDPTIKPHEHFAAATYTGAGGSEEIDLGFTPNLTWIKRRVDSGYYHGLYDSARGLSAGALASNTTDSEDSTQRVASFDSDTGSEGFTLSSTHYSYTNTSGKTFISWNWKESASAGFDIVTYEGNSDSSGDTQSISHSLGVAPEMIIVKARDGRAANDYYARDMWYVWHKDLTSGSSLYLNSTSVEVDYSSGYTSAPISSVGSSTFTVCNAEEYNNYYYDFLNWGDPYGYYTGSNERYVAYLFSSVEGVSKVGSYTGNGSANGPFVYTGFRPAFVMVKPIEASYSWYMHDTARSPYNYSDLELTANSSGAEYSVSGAGGGHRLDILSNGFKHRTSNVAMNQSGYKYAFLAFSESPLKYANGR